MAETIELALTDELEDMIDSTESLVFWAAAAAWPPLIAADVMAATPTSCSKPRSCQF
jgi:hypothetical protein